MSVPRRARVNDEEPRGKAADAADAAHVPADNVLAAIHVVSNRISRAFYADIEARHGISLPEWRVMLTLTRHPGMAAMAVAALWGMDKMAISRAVQRLARAGLVRRTPAADDRRRWVLELTTEGRRRYKAIEPAATQRYRDFLSALAPREVAQLRRLLEKLIGGSAASGA
jgi:DNA-binding MarR family transcriptional regulator